jgi:hypothetical protein
MSSVTKSAVGSTSSTKKRRVNNSSNEVAGAGLPKKSKPLATSSKGRTRSTSTVKNKTKKFKGFPQKAPLAVPAEVDPDTTWRWWDQWQVWQARRRDTGKKTLFCGLCAFVCPSGNKMLKHFLAEHGDKKFYSCMYCGGDEKRFCLLTNLRTHLEEVHGTCKDPWRYEWGPEEQQTMMDDYDDYYDVSGYRRMLAEEAALERLEAGEEPESDHEYHEEHKGDTDPDESGPDSEGACDRDSDDD